MQKDMVAWLRANASLAARLAAYKGKPSIHWVRRPNTAKLPAITLTDITTTPTYDQDGRGNLEPTFVQVDVWSDRYGPGVDILNIVRDLIEAGATQGETIFEPGFLESGPRPLGSEDLPGGQRVYHRTADFKIWHKPN